MADLCILGCGRSRRPMTEIRAFVGQGAEPLEDAALRARLTLVNFEMWGDCQECAQRLMMALLTAGHFAGDSVPLEALPGMLATGDKPTRTASGVTPHPDTALAEQLWLAAWDARAALLNNYIEQAKQILSRAIDAAISARADRKEGAGRAS